MYLRGQRKNFWMKTGTMTEKSNVFYWDTSAILSVIFKDKNTDLARRWIHTEGFHFISTLAYAETCAVINRMYQEGILTRILVKAVYEILEACPLHRISLQPAWKTVKSLATGEYLRGADLWHISLVKTLQEELPELELKTFDTRLQKAADKLMLKTVKQ